MQNTINFNLNKPEGTDIYNIQNENDNMDIIDAALAKAYFTDDSASTELANADYLPFYDTSASEKKKMLLSTARNDVRARIAESVSNDVMETIGGTALNSYSVGQYFLGNDGYYYVTTSAITGGSSTISTGVSGNCSKTSIAAGMNNLTSQISNLNTNLASKMNASQLEDLYSKKCLMVGRRYFRLNFPRSTFTTQYHMQFLVITYAEATLRGLIVGISASNVGGDVACTKQDLTTDSLSVWMTSDTNYFYCNFSFPTNVYNSVTVIGSDDFSLQAY